MIKAIGWSSFFEKEYCKLKKPQWIPGRVSQQKSQFYTVITEKDTLISEVSGKLKHVAKEKSQLPVVGDWVAINPLWQEKKGVIHHILPRYNKLSRRSAGQITSEQVMGANIDIAFVVAGCDGEFNVNRIIRYVTLIRESKIKPYVILNKIDQCKSVSELSNQLLKTLKGVLVLEVSALKKIGLDLIRKEIGFGQTAILVGSSGTGKSSIINALFGKEIQKVGEVRHGDRKGRHITTYREMIFFDQGVIIDTPGLREIQLWLDDEQIQDSFEDIRTLALSCKYNNCSHTVEPQCAVQAALDRKEISTKRFENYAKLQSELTQFHQQKQERFFS